MKTKKIFSLLIFVFILTSLTTLSSCSKYEEGPSISLRTKKARITNIWKLIEFKEDGVDYTSDFEIEFILDIRKDDTYLLTYDNEIEKGKWMFSSNKEELILLEEDGRNNQNWTIVRLANDEFWVKFTVDGLRYEMKFEEK